MIQQNLFESELEAKFNKYHRDNPHVYRLLLRFTLEALRAGKNNWGMKGVYERARWYADIETKGDSFKLNNNYTAFYSRLLMSENPETLTGFFTIREQTSGGKAYEEDFSH